MEKFNQEYDPLTGVITQQGFVDDKLVIRKDADIGPNIEYATSLRNSDQYSRDGIKKGFFHVATVDQITQIELLKIGVDVFRASGKEIVAGIRKLNREYLLTTNKQV